MQTLKKRRDPRKPWGSRSRGVVAHGAPSGALSPSSSPRHLGWSDQRREVENSTCCQLALAPAVLSALPPRQHPETQSTPESTERVALPVEKLRGGIRALWMTVSGTKNERRAPALICGRCTISVPACFVRRGAAESSRHFLGWNVAAGTGEARAGGWGLHQDLRLRTGTLWSPISVTGLEQSAHGSVSGC